MTLAALAAKAGLTVIDRGDGHLQILGGARLVNYYPRSKRRSAYVVGMVEAHRNVTAEQAVMLALNPQPLDTKVTRDTRRRSYRKIRERIYTKDNTCYRCGKPIETFADASLEHIIPLRHGGINHRTNMAVSHRECNQLAGDAMPGEHKRTPTKK